MAISPGKVLKDAIKAVPAVKYALGIAGIVAAIAIVKGFEIDFRIAVFGTVIMLVLMTVLVIFAKAAASAAVGFVGPATVLTWFSLLLVIGTATLLFWSVFFKWPVDLQWVLQKHDASSAEKFVGIWESADLKDPPAAENNCLQDVIKKFRLELFQSSQYSFVTRFSFENNGTAHRVRIEDPQRACPDPIRTVHGGMKFDAMLIGASDDVLTINVDSWRGHQLLKFKLLSENKLVALPGGVDTFLNNDNRASLKGAELLFYRR
jgi:hypothetical protein